MSLNKISSISTDRNYLNLGCNDGVVKDLYIANNIYIQNKYYEFNEILYINSFDNPLSNISNKGHLYCNRDQIRIRIVDTVNYSGPDLDSQFFVYIRLPELLQDKVIDESSIMAEVWMRGFSTGEGCAHSTTTTIETLAGATGNFFKIKMFFPDATAVIDNFLMFTNVFINFKLAT